MDFDITHEDGEDFGTITLAVERDDTATVDIDGTYGVRIRFSLYNHEAKRLIEQLAVIAEADDLV